MNRTAMSIGIFISMMMLASCANMVVGGIPLSGLLKPKPTVSKWVPVQDETYVDVERGKLTTTAFADDYDNKLVTFKASFFKIQDRPRISDYDPKEYLGVWLAGYGGDTAGSQLFNIAQKKMYGTLSKLKQMSPVQVWGRAFKLRTGTLGLYIHKIEKIKS